VDLQEFIAWFRKDPSRNKKAGRELLQSVCGTGKRIKTLGAFLSSVSAKALEETFDEELAHLAQVAKAPDVDGVGIVAEEEMKEAHARSEAKRAATVAFLSSTHDGKPLADS
jgi:hypothetical protein